MKKILPVIFLITFGFSAHPQGIVFKPKYLPDHSYKISMNMNMNMTMDITGNESEMQAIKKKGVKLPMQVTSNIVTESSIKTGSMTQSNYFPMIFTYENITSKTAVNGEDKPSPSNPLSGVSIVCRYTNDGKISVDSIPGQRINDNMRDVLTKTVTTFVNNLHFPNRPLNIGDTCSQQVPFNIPIPGINTEMNINVQYKLISVRNNIAKFDVSETLDMNMKSEQAGKTLSMTGGGKGTGTVLYDIAQNMGSAVNIDLAMNYKMLIGDITMIGDGKIISSHNVTIMSATK